MADITKKVDRGIPGNERYIVFNETEVSGGDIFLVDQSLGRPAGYCMIEADAALVFSFNVYRTVIPRRLSPPFNSLDGDGRPNLALATSMFVSGQELALASGESFELDNDLQIRDIHIVSAAGTYTVLLS